MNSSIQRFTSDDVYLGVWINWSHGRIRGATLSMSRRNGGLLIAFLTLLVGTAGTSFWRIDCYFIHCYFSSKNAADALYHQKQTILRNSVNSQSGLVTLLQTCWAWRRITIASLWRFFSSISFAIITFIGFTISGIFSSAVATSMGQDVLLRGPNCGIWGLDHDGTDQYRWMEYYSKGLSSSLIYAQRCYRTGANPRDCAVFFQPKLQWKADHNATCSFPGKEICLNNFGNLRLDSGYINSDHHLGINNPPETRFFVRTVVECAPLRTRGYTKNNTFGVEDEKFGTAYGGLTEYFYGKAFGSMWNSTNQFAIKNADSETYFGYDTTGYYEYALRSVDWWSCSGNIGS